MGPRMALNTDLENIFSMYANQVSEKTSLKDKSEKEKHGKNYKKQTSKLSNDAYVSSLKGSEKIKKNLIFKYRSVYLLVLHGAECLSLVRVIGEIQ